MQGSGFRVPGFGASCWTTIDPGDIFTPLIPPLRGCFRFVDLTVLGFRFSGFGFRVPGFRSWASDFGFWVSDFGFRGSAVPRSARPSTPGTSPPPPSPHRAGFSGSSVLQLSVFGFSVPWLSVVGLGFLAVPRSALPSTPGTSPSPQGHRRPATHACFVSYQQGVGYRGTSLIRNSPPPSGHRKALGVVLL